MAATVTSPRPATGATHVPPWVNLAAHVVPWTTVPSGLWRIALGLGVPVGFSGQLADLYRAPGWITPYVIALSLLAEGLALLTLGLVRPWGEVVPRWIPVLGGRPIPTAAAVVPAGLGAVAVVRGRREPARSPATSAGSAPASGPRAPGRPRRRDRARAHGPARPKPRPGRGRTCTTVATLVLSRGRSVILAGHGQRRLASSADPSSPGSARVPARHTDSWPGDLVEVVVQDRDQALGGGLLRAHGGVDGEAVQQREQPVGL